MISFVKKIMIVIAVAGLVACPVAYAIMKRWLDDYVYRIDITPSPFVLTILMLAVITAVLIVMQTIKAALGNPVKSLKSEWLAAKSMFFRHFGPQINIISHQQGFRTGLFPKFHIGTNLTIVFIFALQRSNTLWKDCLSFCFYSFPAFHPDR